MTNKLTSNSRVTIPKKVREHLGIVLGSWVAFDIDANGDVRLRKSCRSAPLTVPDSRFAEECNGVKSRNIASSNEVKGTGVELISTNSC